MKIKNYNVFFLLTGLLFCLPVFGQTAKDHLDAGDAKMNAKDYSGAVDEYNKAIETDPNNATAYFDRGKARFDMKACECGTADFDQAIGLNPNYPDAYASRAIVYNCMNDTIRAKIDINRSLSMDKNNATAYEALSYLDIVEGKYQKALDDINMASKLNPMIKKTSYYYKGMAYLGLQKYDLAKKNFDKSLEMDPAQKDVYLSRAEAWMNKGRRNKAIADYDMFLKYDPDNQAVHFTKGLVLLDMHDYKESADELGKCIALDPTHSDYYLARGLAYAKMKNYASAINDMKHSDSMHVERLGVNDSQSFFTVPYIGTLTGMVCRSCDMAPGNAGYYNSLTMLDPEYRAEAYYYECLTMKKTGTEAGACADCERAEYYGYKKAKRYAPKVCTAPASVSAASK